MRCGAALAETAPAGAEADTGPSRPRTDAIRKAAPAQRSNRDAGLWAAYLLFLAGPITGGLSVLAGAVMAWLAGRGVQDPILRSHSRWLNRTFWGSAALLVGSIALPWSVIAWRFWRFVGADGMSLAERSEYIVTTAAISSLGTAVLGVISVLGLLSLIGWFVYRTGKGLLLFTRDEPVGPARRARCSPVA